MSDVRSRIGYYNVLELFRKMERFLLPSKQTRNSNLVCENEYINLPQPEADNVSESNFICRGDWGQLHGVICNNTANSTNQG